MSLQQGPLLYTGKAKSLYKTEDADYLIMEFRDDATAFNGVKKSQLARKGQVNNHFNAYIMRYLEAQGVHTQFVDTHSETQSVVKHLDMICVESVVRNVAAGNLAKRLGLEEGTSLNLPTQEFFLKNDKLDDPMVNESIIQSFSWASLDEITKMKQLSYQVNDILKALFLKADLLLVDFKLEFGRSNGELVLGDEFTPDGCRIWDVNTREKLDKDRFRRDLGNVIESYELVAQRLGIDLQLPA
jgi:phosphoribosylaminoimidazole-succinocarboxamide synthase